MVRSARTHKTGQSVVPDRGGRQQGKTQQGREQGHLGTGGQKGGDGGRGPLVDIRGPQMKGHDGDLEADAREDEGQGQEDHRQGAGIGVGGRPGTPLISRVPVMA